MSIRINPLKWNPSEADDVDWREKDFSHLEPIDETVERALEVSLPFQYSQQTTYRDTLPSVGLEREYTSAEVILDGGVTRRRQLKLHARGYLWNDEFDHDGNGQRFKVQLRRPAPPVDVEPFESYQYWYRYQPGVVRLDRSLEFEPADEATTERGDLEFSDVPPPLKHHVAKLEIVRYPPFAAHILRERGLWEEYGKPLRWDPEAFE